MSIASTSPGIPVGSPCLVGVSGGRDSVALLHWLRHEIGKNVVVCHFNHAMRGDESNEDAAFVEDLALSLGLVFECASAQATIENETTAREARYQFFADRAATLETSDLFLAHHADDQAETILLNLCRGSGTRGLAGMQEVATRSISGTNLTIRRPWLAVSRTEIDAYIAESGLTFREDLSNADPDATARNRLRLELGRAMNREITPAILRASELYRADDELLEGLVSEQWAELVDESAHLRVDRLRQLPLALQRRSVRRWLRETLDLADIGFFEIESVLALIGPLESSPSKVNLPRACHIRRRSGRLFLEMP